ncbi:MAG: nitroreductase family deazaflavin-dependent oxidoreductase [Anaerolineae bacterium]|nr:nitroreductase family deazaflavin-dependent oxidoreductase [Anaerolineae bacterium]
MSDGGKMIAPCRQATQGFMTYPTSRWRKRISKIPLYLWRLGLGPLLPAHLLLLTATGRKSGLPRTAALEYTEVNGKKYVASGWGKRSQWYKNVMTDPYVTVQTGPGGAEPGEVRRVTGEDELRALFAVFRHSPAWDIYLESWGVAPHAEDFIAQKHCLYLLRIDPTGAPTPPPVEADLKWVWAAALGLLALWAVAWLAGRSERD